MRITDREYELLKMVAVGKSHREIAKRMGVCTRTVATYQCNLGKKIKAHSAVEIAHFALHLGLVKNLFDKANAEPPPPVTEPTAAVQPQATAERT